MGSLSCERPVEFGWYRLERPRNISLMGEDLSQASKNKEHFVGRKVPRICSRHEADGSGTGSGERGV